MSAQCTNCSQFIAGRERQDGRCPFCDHIFPQQGGAQATSSHEVHSEPDTNEMERLFVPGFTVKNEDDSYLFKLNGCWGRDKPYMNITILGVVVFAAVALWVDYFYSQSAIMSGLLFFGWVAYLVLVFIFIARVEHFISFDRNRLKIWTQNKLGVFRSEQSIPTESIEDFRLHRSTVATRETRGILVIQHSGVIKLCFNNVVKKCNGLLMEELRGALFELQSDH